MLQIPETSLADIATVHGSLGGFHTYWPAGSFHSVFSPVTVGAVFSVPSSSTPATMKFGLEASEHGPWPAEWVQSSWMP